MARYDHLPIWAAAFANAVAIEHAVARFPRSHRYVLGADLRRVSQRICALIVRANEARDERGRVLEPLTISVEQLKRVLNRCRAALHDFEQRHVVTARVPRRALTTLRRRLKRAGIAHLIVIEEGLRRHGRRRRSAALSWSPAQPTFSFTPCFD